MYVITYSYSNDNLLNSNESIPSAFLCVYSAISPLGIKRTHRGTEARNQRRCSMYCHVNRAQIEQLFWVALRFSAEFYYQRVCKVIRVRTFDSLQSQTQNTKAQTPFFS